MTHGQAKHRIATIANDWRDGMGIDYDPGQSINTSQLDDKQAEYDDAAAVLGFGLADEFFHEIYHSP